jgi:hypothetical protein
VFGKINIIDIAASSPFRGGAGIDAFWNTVFAATPSGSVVNKSGFEEPFTDGVTFRGSVEFPVTIAGRRGHQGFVALYSTKSGTDLEGLDDILIPPFQKPLALRTIVTTSPIRLTNISSSRRRIPRKALGCLDSSASQTAIPIGYTGWPMWVWAAPA